MSGTEPVRGRAVVVQPEEGPSYWQPVPANGHADPKLYPANTGFAGLSMGYQTIAPGARVRAHSHGDQVELQICFRGRGRVVVDGTSHPLGPGTACFLGHDVKHEIINEGAEALVMLLGRVAPGPRGFLLRDRPAAAARRAGARALRAAGGRGGDRARDGDERHPVSPGAASPGPSGQILGASGPRRSLAEQLSRTLSAWW
jgi:quercetin dioxygenase-like cupin family protein